MSMALDTDADCWRTVRDVADESGVAPSAVRFYERHGVIVGIRTAGNQRRFDDAAACRIKVAKLAQRVGFTVREIADLFTDLPSDPQPRIGIASPNSSSPSRTATHRLEGSIEAMKTGDKLCAL